MGIRGSQNFSGATPLPSYLASRPPLRCEATIRFASLRGILNGSNTVEDRGGRYVNKSENL